MWTYGDTLQVQVHFTSCMASYYRTIQRGWPLGEIALLSLVAEPAVQAELEWFFQRAESAIGIRSTFESMVSQLRSGRSESVTVLEPLTEERRRKAVRRMRHIREALARTDVQTRHILASAFEPRAWNVEVRRVFRKPIDGVAFLVYGDLYAFIQKKQTKEAVRSQVARCERLFADACRTYAAQKRELRWAA